MSVSDIENELRNIYEINLSGSSISIITNKVIQGLPRIGRTDLLRDNI